MNQTEMRLAAAARGENKYNTGQPCKRGHMSDRYVTTGACIECIKPMRTKPRVMHDVRLISRSVPFALDRRVATSDRFLAGWDQYMQQCSAAYVQHLEDHERDFPAWCFDCQGKGKTIDPKRLPVVMPCTRCKGLGLETIPSIDYEAIERAQYGDAGKPK